MVRGRRELQKIIKASVKIGMGIDIKLSDITYIEHNDLLDFTMFQIGNVTGITYFVDRDRLEMTTNGEQLILLKKF